MPHHLIRGQTVSLPSRQALTDRGQIQQEDIRTVAGDPDADADTFEDIDVDDSMNPTDKIDPDHLVMTSLKNDVFDINSINKVYESWDQTEKSAALHAPVLITTTTAFSDEMLSAAMTNEFESLKSFDVVSEMTREPISSDKEILDVSWVHIWKGFVKSRLVIRGDQQQISSDQDHFANTPYMIAIRICLWLSELMQAHIDFLDVSTAFLHAIISDEVCSSSQIILSV